MDNFKTVSIYLKVVLLSNAIVPKVLLCVLKHFCVLKSGQTYNDLVNEKIKADEAIKPFFKKSMSDSLSTNDAQQYDVSLLNFLLIYLCPQLKLKKYNKKKKNSLEHYIHELVQLRNSCFHSTFKTVSIKFKDVQILDNARDTILSLMTNDKLKSKIDPKDFKDIYLLLYQEICDILDRPLTLIGNEQYLLDCLCLGINELKHLYEYQNIFDFIDICCPPIKTSDIFIDLRMLNSESEDIKMSSLLNNFVKKSNKNKKSQGRCILIEGPAGSGKSTLLKYIITQWKEDFSIFDKLDEYDFIFYIQCRNVVISSLKGYFQLITPFLFKDRNFDYILFLNCLKEKQVLFLIDGLDEINSFSSKLLQEIKTEFIVADVLITSRSEGTNNVRIVLPENTCITHLQLIGIEEQKWELFIRKYWIVINSSNLPITTEQLFLDQISSRSFEMRDILTIPLNLVFSIYLYKICGNENCLFDLQCDFISYLTEFKIKSLIKKLEMDETDTPVPYMDNRDKIDNVLKCIEETAFICSAKNEDLMNDKESLYKKLRMECKKEKLKNPDRIISNFLLYEAPNIFSSSPTFSFPHRIFKEYFTAKHLLDQLSEVGLISKALISDSSNVIDPRKHRHCLLMLLGLMTQEDRVNSLSENQAKDILSVLFEENQLMLKFSEIYEVLNAARFNLIFAKLLSSHVQRDEWFIQSYESFRFYCVMIKLVQPNMLCIVLDKYNVTLKDPLFKLLNEFIPKHKNRKFEIIGQTMARNGELDDILKHCKTIRLNYGLTKFVGTLSKPCFKLLPKAIQHLHIGIRNTGEAEELSKWIKSNKFDETLVVEMKHDVELTDVLRDKASSAIIHHQIMGQSDEDQAQALMSVITALYSPCSPADDSGHTDRYVLVRIHSDSLTKNGIKLLTACLMTSSIFIWLEISSPHINDGMELEIFKDVHYTVPEDHKQHCQNCCWMKCRISRI